MNPFRLGIVHCIDEGVGWHDGRVIGLQHMGDLIGKVARIRFHFLPHNAAVTVSVKIAFVRYPKLIEQICSTLGLYTLTWPKTTGTTFILSLDQSFSVMYCAGFRLVLWHCKSAFLEHIWEVLYLHINLILLLNKVYSMQQKQQPFFPWSQSEFSKER